MTNQANIYKGFYIKYVPSKEGGSGVFVATLQALRFTGVTRTALKDKIDRNAYLIADMAGLAFASKASRIADAGDELDYLLDNLETHAVIAGLTHGKLDTQIGAY